MVEEAIALDKISKNELSETMCEISAIEARVLSWLAGEKWRTEVFINNGD